MANSQWYEMTCCIFTVANRAYEIYAPLFRYCINKEYPEYDVEIYEATNGPYSAAALRFVLGDDMLEKYDCVLITDIDIMIRREKNTIVEQHMAKIIKNKTDCYDNYLVIDRCPGVHFVTQTWWDKTINSRFKEYFHIKMYDVEKDYDEKMILRIIRDSKLPDPSSKLNLWAQHGLHLGSMRNRLNKKITYSLNADDGMQIRKLLEDDEFMSLVEKQPKIKEIFEAYKRRM